VKSLTKRNRASYNELIQGGVIMEQTMMQELVEGLREIMGERTVRIVLYGSVARGTQEEDSDIDIAIFLNRKFDSQTEDRLSEFAVNMDLKYDKVFSIVDIDYENYRKWEAVLPFYQNVAREGVVLWKAA
jgi:uncharacterized protein